MIFKAKTMNLKNIMSNTITQKQYNLWLKNLNKNKSGWSWIHLCSPSPEEANSVRTKLFKDAEDRLDFKKNGECIYLKIDDGEPVLEDNVPNEPELEDNVPTEYEI